MEGRYVLARLRAVEERLKAASETLDLVDKDEAGRLGGPYLAGYARGLLEGAGHVRRLREGLSSQEPRDAK